MAKVALVKEAPPESVDSAPAPKKGKGKLIMIVGLTVLLLGGGELFVTDGDSGRLLKASLLYTPRSQCGGDGADSGRFSQPAGVAWLGGEVFVADTGNGRLVKIHP